MRAINWFIGHIFSWSLDMKGWIFSYLREVILLCSNRDCLRWIGLLRQQPDLPALYLSVNHDIHTVRSDMQWFAHECFQKSYDKKSWGRSTQIISWPSARYLRSQVALDWKSLITSRYYRKMFRARKKSRWRQKVVDGKVVDDRIYCIVMKLYLTSIIN